MWRCWVKIAYDGIDNNGDGAVDCDDFRAGLIRFVLVVAVAEAVLKTVPTELMTMAMVP